MHLVRTAVCAVLLWSSQAAAECANPEQFQAAQLRQFHYQLQVAALNCRGDDPSLPGKWQDYIRRHAALLADNARTLKAYFKSDSALDRHNTVVTNHESVAVHETPGYCEMRAPMFDKVLTLTRHQMSDYAVEQVPSPDNVRACGEAKKVKKAN
ncbi:heme utilization protein [Paramagnetospirillum kuznetsovii]|uniref:Heme utilization protein n=1 Tax=Paramagnetospirillum kuznetsovii TaxID=2053833 RepID=A0A364NWD8_9PROT|nr:heme utilization protein [Paramagnetospirillum kuznetsovii]RAU21409.1 heme utilization protein [Paramagnetospirillum kuznetsovii]